MGESDQWAGVYGKSDQRPAVAGQSDGGTGVHAASATGLGISSRSGGKEALRAEATAGNAPAVRAIGRPIRDWRDRL